MSRLSLTSARANGNSDEPCTTVLSRSKNAAVTGQQATHPSRRPARTRGTTTGVQQVVCHTSPILHRIRSQAGDIDAVRVAIVAESSLPRVNGVSGSVVRTTRHLKSRGHHVDIIAPEPAPLTSIEGAPVQTVRSISVPGMSFDVGYATISRLEGLLRHMRPDVVHLASPLVLGRQALRAARALGIPTVAVFQTDITGFARHYRLGAAASLSDALISRIHRDADLTLAPSSASQAYLAEVGVDRVALWGRGVDTSQFHPLHRSRTLRQGWSRHAEEEPIIVGFVGRLAPEKRVAMLAPLDSDPRFHLVIVGDGPQRDELRALLPNATFTGLLTGEALGITMASFDILTAPGEQETFCQVVQEGMASGVPVIAPAIGGPRDLVLHGETGLLYTPGSMQGLVDAVSALGASPATRKAMGSRARELVEGRTWESIGDQLIDHYESVRSGPDSRSLSPITETSVA